MTSDTVMYWGGAITALIADRLAGAILTRVERRRAARLKPNVVDGLILPLPDDERWARQPCSDANVLRGLSIAGVQVLQLIGDSDSCPGCWAIGEVQVCEEHGLCVSGDQVDAGEASERYVRLVMRAQRERLALAAALGDGGPCPSP